MLPFMNNLSPKKNKCYLDVDERERREAVLPRQLFSPDLFSLYLAITSRKKQL